MSVLELKDDSDVFVRVRLDAVPSLKAADDDEAKETKLPAVTGDGARALMSKAIDKALADFMGAQKSKVDILSCDVIAGDGKWSAHAILQTRLGAVTMLRGALTLAAPKENGCPLVFVVEAVAPALVSVAVNPHEFEESIVQELMTTE